MTPFTPKPKGYIKRAPHLTRFIYGALYFYAFNIKKSMAYRVNYWEDDWSRNPKRPSRRLKKEVNNEKIKESAEIHAWEMRIKPSWLEKQMMEFLDNHSIKYEFQKIFYIADKNQYIQRYFIADFFIPDRNLIIEMDGKFHKEQIKYDKMRTELIKEHYRKIKVIRFTYNDVVNMGWENMLKRINMMAYSSYRKAVKKIRKEEQKIKRIKARPSATS